MQATSINRLALPFSLIVFFAFCTTISISQKSLYIYEQFTTVEGLPSNECHEVFEDHQGFIWIGTDNGLARYDGNEFKIYGEAEGLYEKVIFEVKGDSLGRIWVSGLDAQVYIYNAEEDRFTPYRYNHLLKSYKTEGGNSLRYIYEINFLKDTALFYTYPMRGVIRISEDGNLVSNYYSLTEDWGAILCNGYVDLYRSDWYGKFEGYQNIEILDTSILVKKYNARNTTNIGSLGKSTFINFLRSLIIIENNKIVKQVDFGEVGEFSATNVGIATCFLNNEGVKIYKDASFDECESIIDDISATGFIKDKKGGYWITSLTKGLFYIRNPKIQFVNHDTKNGFYNHICTSNNIVYSSLFEGEIFQINKNNNQLLKKYNSEISSIEQDPYTNMVWYSTVQGLFSLKAKSTFNNRYRNKNQHFDFDKTHIWMMSNKGSLSLISKENFKLIQNFNRKKNITFLKSICIYAKGEYVFIGANSGLYSIRKEKLKSDKNLDDFELISDFENIRIEHIIKGKNAELIIATKGKGIAFYTPNEKTVFYDENDGLLSDDIENIYLDSDNNLWITTLKGINKITNYNTNEQLVYKLTTSHGLPVPDAYDITEKDKDMYVCMGKGIIKINKDIGQLDVISKPKITSFKVDNTSYNLARDISLSHDKNIIHVDFNTLNYAHKDKIIHRYRLNKNEWNLTNDRDVLLTNLSPETYHLEIQAQNEDGNWSESSSVHFVIDYPWWRTYTFYILVALGIILLTWLIIRNRLKITENENKLKEEIKDLEKAALSAQMSPHFIFNCLNSIQRYIMDKEKKVAMEYLAKFSSLIRMYLNVSVSDKIKLSDEIRMLEYYLELEQLRFNSSFTYDISIDSSVDQNAYIPSMIIQPFVENAVLHGMKYKENNEGKIKLSLKKQEEILHISIIDNGPGIENAEKESAHDSQGLNITQRRLQLIEESLKDESVYTIDSSEKGTRIDLRIPVEIVA